MELIVFYAVAVAALVSALVAVSHRSPIVNVLSLVVTFFCIAMNFALLGAGFLAAAQVLIYAGAILVLFLFVVMLLNAPQLPPAAEPRHFQHVAGIALAVLVAAGAAGLLANLGGQTPQTAGATVQALGRALVGPYLFAFELVSVLLIAAMVGAFVLVKRRH
jgi:NADH-quinone oxidoreductase subunit J